MTNNNIDKSAKIFEQIVKVNARIKTIHAMASLAAEKPVESMLELKMNDLSRKTEMPESFDPEHLFPAGMNKIDIGAMLRNAVEKKISSSFHFIGQSGGVDEYDNIIRYELSNETQLRILELLLHEAQEERTYYLKQLSEMGIKI